LNPAAPLTAEDVAYWYLRLNGFLTLENFLVHGDRGGDSRTDIDVLGVRFRFRREHLKNPMKDAPWIEEAKQTIVVFCEAKKNSADLNSSWADQQRKIMESFLALVGAIPPGDREIVAKDLYTSGRSVSAKGLLVTTLLVNHAPSGMAARRWPDAPRIDLAEALEFIHDRFQKYQRIKTDHGQWRPSGRRIWDIYIKHWSSPADFIEQVLREIGA
jgi:hypothetical protein